MTIFQPLITTGVRLGKSIVMSIESIQITDPQV